MQRAQVKNTRHTLHSVHFSYTFLQLQVFSSSIQLQTLFQQMSNLAAEVYTPHTDELMSASHKKSTFLSSHMGLLPSARCHLLHH